MQNSKFKIGVAVGLLIVAAGIVIYTNTGSEIPSDVDRSTYWYCPKCDAGFELKDPPPEGSLVEVAIEPEDSGKPSPVRQVRKTVTMAKCPTCGEAVAVAGVKCAECGAAFRKFNDKGDVLICPKCKWDPVTGKKAAGDREYILDD
ncbi:MAG: hypothetical protein H6818_04730 [Phycisphaerales bacterium]|nr:hypothetical protein [Phycisphaerales bacterium]